MIETVDRILALLPRLQASISPSLHLNVAIDRTTTIRASVHDVEITLIISITLVILVVFAFLRSYWATNYSQCGRAALPHRHFRRHVFRTGLRNGV